MNMHVCACTYRKDSGGSDRSSGGGEQNLMMNYTFATIQYNL